MLRASSDQAKNAKFVRDTEVEMVEVVNSSMISPFHQYLSAGQLMRWMDICGCMSAEKLCGTTCVTATMDDLIFSDNRVKVGEIVSLRAQVNRAWNTSMEVGVKVFAEDLLRSEHRHVCSAYFSFVSEKKITLPTLLPETEANKRRFAEALERRKIRLQRRETLQKVWDNERVKSDDNAKSMSGEDLKTLSSLKSSTLDMHHKPKYPDKPASSSFTEITELILPVHANHMQTMFGGQTMEWMKTCASIAATRFARKPVAVKSIDDIHFFCPIKVGNRVVIKAQVNRCLTSTMEVGVRLDKLTLEGEVVHALSAYMIFATLDSQPIPFNLVVSSEDEKRRFHKALGRKLIRLQRRTVRTPGQQLSPQWNNNTALDLIYANIRNLLSFSNCSMYRDDGWELVHELPSRRAGEPIRLYSQNNATDQNITCLKLECVVMASPQEVYQVALDSSRRKEWDSLFQEGKVVEKIDETNDIVYNVFKSERGEPLDFCLLRSWRTWTDLDPQYVISNCSVSHEAVPSQEPKYVRGEVLSSGFIIRPIVRNVEESDCGAEMPPESPSEPPCSLTYVVQLGTKALSLVVEEAAGQSKYALYSFAKLVELVEGVHELKRQAEGTGKEKSNL